MFSCFDGRRRDCKDIKPLFDFSQILRFLFQEWRKPSTSNRSWTHVRCEFVVHPVSSISFLSWMECPDPSPRGRHSSQDFCPTNRQRLNLGVQCLWWKCLLPVRTENPAGPAVLTDWVRTRLVYSASVKILVYQNSGVVFLCCVHATLIFLKV